MSRSALVTGSVGFVGRHFVHYLENDGYDVDVCDPLGPDGGDARELFMQEYKYYDLVVHAAASAPYRKAIDTEPQHFAYNSGLDALLFTWAARTRPGRVVYLSSSAAYPVAYQGAFAARDRAQLEESQVSLADVHEPDAVYGWAKLTGERLAGAAFTDGLAVTVVRPFSGYGEDQTEDFPFGAIVERARRGENPLPVQGSGEQVRDFIHVDDVVAGTMALVRAQVVGPTNLCTGVGTSIRQLASLAAQVAGYDADVRGESGPGAPSGTGVRHRVGSPRRLHQFYHPRVSLAQGVARRLGVA